MKLKKKMMTWKKRVEKDKILNISRTRMSMKIISERTFLLCTLQVLLPTNCSLICLTKCQVLTKSLYCKFIQISLELLSGYEPNQLNSRLI
jgi:hypothetical protein